MTMEITIRFANAHIDHDEFFTSVKEFDTKAHFKGYLIGGLYFTTERTVDEFFEFLERTGMGIMDFENIEFKPVRT